MYVKRVFYDDLSNPNNYFFHEINESDWNDILKIIKGMDGQLISQITMDNGDEDNYLCIGGGNNGLFNLYISLDDNSKIYTLINSNPIKSKMNKLVTGGQEAYFEDYICVEIKAILEVAKFYYETGEVLDKYNWEILD